MNIKFVINKFSQFLLLLVPISAFSFFANYMFFLPSENRLQVSLSLGILESLIFTPLTFLILIHLAHRTLTVDKALVEYKRHLSTKKYWISVDIYNSETGKTTRIRDVSPTLAIKVLGDLNEWVKNK